MRAGGRMFNPALAGTKRPFQTASGLIRPFVAQASATWLAVNGTIGGTGVVRAAPAG